MPLRRPSRQSVLNIADALSGIARFLFPQNPDSIRLEAVTVQIADLPDHLDGFTIGALSDLHLGPLVPTALVRRAADLLAARRPDLIVVTGDILSKSSAAPEIDQALGSLSSRYGTYGVYGNWDHTRRQVLRTQRSIRFLQNEGLEVAPALWLAGVDETVLGHPNLDRSLAGAPPGAVRILLAHEPDYADKVQPHHNIALQISGHSHGGQIRLPILGPIMLPRAGRKYATALNQAPNCQVYTSRGIGVVHIPLRLWCPPEVTVITLRKR